VQAPAQRQCPQAVDLDRLCVLVFERAEKVPVSVVRMDPAVTEVADQNGAAEPAEVERSRRDASG
jgi:hypothetical protein